MEKEEIKTEQIPKVGIGVMIIKNNKVLLGIRKGSHGEGEYSFPVGHLEYKESFEECAAREVKEECGIEIKNLRFQFLANVLRYYPKHYVHIGMIAEWSSGEPVLLEPDKCYFWRWYDLDCLPYPLFNMCSLAIDSYNTGIMYYDLENKKKLLDNEEGKTKRIIEKKVWPKFFESVSRGNKKFDLRLADFECEEGDILVLQEWNPIIQEYTGRSVEKEITFVLKTKDLEFWTEEEIEKYGFQIISLK